ncbi:osmotically inducible protein C [Enterococcus plantarum]|uniref:Organic hydroperoxide resistance protein n=1 Tax=Enterococcus plantarum TaxID=1077675 RepID=A0A2W3Z6H2_9ENTE|nr:organic hydroperoxide resistance protein [Enterococcus plantarum]MBO0422052.1 organic hydroperoxide resistance protein [Enterococcus plantarum]MBO0466752.1 organic hydroperoxide resistance protein [Enterococcus plantarum]OEG13242.1 osmotically inducible protein C [Enterococcus plantarum]PZL75336.1 organic hydroperoxide resistance protein [Enterococcus plantarum]
MKKIYSTTIINTGGREGEVFSPDKSFSYQVTSPGPHQENKTNPEQLFAAAYSSCFNSALELVMANQKITSKSTVKATVSLFSDEESGFQVGVVLSVKIDDVDRETAEALVKAAHEVCPYSKATRGNISVELEVE